MSKPLPPPASSILLSLRIELKFVSEHKKSKLIEEYSVISRGFILDTALLHDRIVGARRRPVAASLAILARELSAAALPVTTLLVRKKIYSCLSRDILKSERRQSHEINLFYK